MTESRELIHGELRHRYAQVAQQPKGRFSYPVGRESAEGLLYQREFLDRVPPGVLEHFVGVGNPFSLGEPQPGWTVLDIGCGAGFDSQIAALYVGPAGKVIGVDLTEEMLTVARAGSTTAGVRNLEFRQGIAESLPVESSWADLVISNGVLNLRPARQLRFGRRSGCSSRAVVSRRWTSCSSRSCRRNCGTTSSPGRTESAVRFQVSLTWWACWTWGSWMPKSSAVVVTKRLPTPKPCTSGHASPEKSALYHALGIDSTTEYRTRRAAMKLSPALGPAAGQLLVITARPSGTRRGASPCTRA